MRAWWSLYQNEERAVPFAWYDPVTGLPFNMNSGYTFVFQLVTVGEYYLNKTTGITGAAVVPNATVNILTGELLAVPPGLYLALLTAHNTGSNTDMTFSESDPPIMEILKTPVLAS